MRPTSRSDDSMVTGVGSQTTTDDVRSFEETERLGSRVYRCRCNHRYFRTFVSCASHVSFGKSLFNTPLYRWDTFRRRGQVEREQNNRTIPIRRSSEKRNFILESWVAFAAQKISRGGVGHGSNGITELVALSPCSRNRLQSRGNGGLPMFDVMQSATTLNGGSYPAGGTGSRARDLGLRAQKKLLGRVVSTGAGRSLLIDDATTSLLDNLYKLMERAAKNNPGLDKKQPEKVLKNIVKLSIKVGLLQRNQQLSAADNTKLGEIRTALRAVAMAVVSFYELEFSFDKVYLTKSLERCRSAIQALIKPHLTDKSQDRCDQVFDFLTHPEFLDSVFRQDSEHRPVLGLLVSDINKALDAGHL